MNESDPMRELQGTEYGNFALLIDTFQEKNVRRAFLANSPSFRSTHCIVFKVQTDE